MLRFALYMNMYSQLGLKCGEGSVGDCVMKPERVPLSAVVRDIACGDYHNLALTSNNEVYSWGFGEMYALGHGKDKDELYPKKLNFDNSKEVGRIKVTQVSGGGQHSAIIGRVFSTA